MALKNVFRLTKRRQGELIGQIHKTICCYSDFYVTRARVYLKDVAKESDSVYWLENPKTGDITSLALVEPKYKFEVDNITLTTVGHTISKIQNQIQNILDHLFGDYAEANLLIYCRPLFAKAMQIEERYDFIAFTPDEIKELWPNLANMSTDYFNVTAGETITSGTARKGYTIYLKLSEAAITTLTTSHPELITSLKSKKEAISEEKKAEEAEEEK
jgi:hypothetical protein